MKNIKDIVNIRFSNPKFVFDGKRMRQFTSRKFYDYSGAVIRDSDLHIPKINNSSFLANIEYDKYETKPTRNFSTKGVKEIIYDNEYIGGRLSFDVFNSRINSDGEMDTQEFGSKIFGIQKNELEKLKQKMAEDVVVNNPAMILNIPESTGIYSKYCIPKVNVHYSINKSKNPVNIIKWTPDGRRLITGNYAGEFTLWNGFSFNFDTIMQAHDSPIRCIEYSPTGSFFISSDQKGFIKYWNSCLNNVKIIEMKDGIRDLSFSPNGDKFCAGGDDGEIKIFDTITSKIESVLEGHGWDIRIAKWHNEYSLIASGAKDNLIKLWDPRIKKEICTIHTHKNSILAMVFIQTHQLLSGGKDQAIKQTDIRTAQDVMTYKISNREITSFGVNPHLRNNFCSGSGDGSIYHWQLNDYEPIEIAKNGHENTIWSLAYHSIAHVLASGSADMTTRFWIRAKMNVSEGDDETIDDLEDKHNEADVDDYNSSDRFELMKL